MEEAIGAHNSKPPGILRDLQVLAASLETKLKDKDEEYHKLRTIQIMLEENDEDMEAMRSPSSSSGSRYNSVETASSSGPGAILDPFYTYSITEENETEETLAHDDLGSAGIGSNPMQDLFRLTWPPDFPHPELLYHLYESYEHVLLHGVD
jgi:hypothetical protein